VCGGGVSTTSGRPGGGGGGVSRRQMASGAPNSSARETERENGISHVRAHVCDKRASEIATGERVRGVLE